MVVELSVIIPNRGNPAELEKCVRGISEQTVDFEYEVIVVDSTPGDSVEKVIKQFPAVRLIHSAARLYPGAARNLGVHHAAGARLAFIDADCVPSSDWIHHARASLLGTHKIIGGPILDLQRRSGVQWVDNQLQFSPFRAGRQEGFVEHLPSCNMVMERATFESLGGFHEGVATGEDVLLTARAEQLYPNGLWFNPKLVVTHRGRRTLRGFIEHQSAMGYHRGWLQLAFTPAWTWLARSPWLAGLAVGRRFGFIGLQTWRYKRKDILLLMLYSPLVLLGLVAWTTGFYRGVARRKAGGSK